MAKIDGNTIETILKTIYCLLRAMDKDVRISKKTLLELPSDWAENVVLTESLEGTVTLQVKRPVKQTILMQDKKLIIPPAILNN